MTSPGVLLIVEIVLFALVAVLGVWGFVRLTRRQGGEAGWLPPLQRALLGPAATLPLAGQALAQGLEDAVLVLDRRGRVIYFNAAAQVLFGAEPLPGRPLAELLAVWWQPALQLWEEGETDFEFTLPGGSFRVRVLPVEASGGRVILIRDLSQQHGLERRLDALQTTDVLTGLANRARLLEMASREVYRAGRYRRALSVVMLRVDDFSTLSDQYGHAAGEQVLQALAQRCRENIRLADSAGRWGEDTFTLLLPETTLEQGRLAAERIRRILAGTPILTSRGEVNVTLSAGVTALDEDAPVTVDLLLDQAARSLYATRAGQVASYAGDASLALPTRLAADPAMTVRLNRRN